MHLESLKLTRFRSFGESTIRFLPDLTVLLGENSGGKSNIIDSIRLVTLPLSGRRDCYADDSDIKRGSTLETFEVEAHYDGLSDTLKGLLISAVPDPTKDEAVFGVRYEISTPKNHRGIFSTWAGAFGTGEPESGSTELVRHVYLPPLRDALKALSSSDGARMIALLRHFIPDGKEDDFVMGVQRTPDSTSVLSDMNEKIADALTSLTDGVRHQGAAVGFEDSTLAGVARDLRFKLADAGIDPSDMRTSGLGYANLLYIATVIVELEHAKEADLTLFLVEEPEAHLHPQLQLVVLEYLLSRAKNSTAQAVTPGEPEGRIQIIITTHSPNLTARVDPKHIVVVRSQTATVGAKTDTSSTTIPIARLGIDVKQLNKIERYLDATRSALLFGRCAVLVEGIAETILLPVFAERFILNGTKNEAALRRFKGILITSIEGVDFEPYVEVLLRKSESNSRIAERVVVVTDGDPSDSGALSGRKTALESLATKHDASSLLTVYENATTLEQELFAAGNEAILKKVFLKCHPRSLSDWQTKIEAVAATDRPSAFLNLIKDKKTRKGDFAQELAATILDGDAFVVPEYLKSAIGTAVQQ
jgi:putative ATP-dependent endonuclease of OLD family